MPTLKTYNKMLDRWGLARNPFKPVPPDDPRDVAKIFAGRQTEVEFALPAIFEGNNILVRGMWGVGKTTFILATLYRLQHETNQMGERVQSIYVRRFSGQTINDFYKAILLPLAVLLAPNDPKAAKVADALRGVRITHSSSAKIKGKAGIHIFSIGSEIGSEIGDNTSEQIVVDNPEHLVYEFLTKGKKAFGRLAIAIDDLDKKDPAALQAILDDATEILRSDKAAFVLTGRALTVAHDAYAAALGLFSESFYLQVMNQVELHQMIINYLNTVRSSKTDDPRPFTSEVVAEIANKSYGIPRQFNVICEKILRIAARKEYESITMDAFRDCFSEMRQGVSLTLTPEMMRILLVAQRSGGLSEDLEDSTLEELGVTTFVELLPAINNLIQQDLLVRLGFEGHAMYIPAAAVGPE